MGLRLITPPADGPLSVEEVKANLHIDYTDDDTLLSSLILEAAEWVEGRIQRKLMTQTWEFVIDEFPSNEIRLPFGPVQSIAQVAYDDTDGNEVIIDAEDYYLDDASPDAWLFPIGDWPSSLLDAVNVVRIQFVAGYPLAGLVPAKIRRAVHLVVRDYYEGSDNSATIHNVLMNEYRMVA